MPDIAGSHNGSQVIVPVVLLPVDSFQSRQNPQWLSKPAGMQVLNALIDTGAQGTCITQNAASKRGLEPSGILPIQGIGGPKLHSVYIFKVGFLDLQETELGLQTPNFYIVEREITGAEFDCGVNANFDVLLGMDILSIVTLTISNTGKFRFTF